MADDQDPELPDGISITDLAGAVADAQLDPARLQKATKQSVNVAEATELAHDSYATKVHERGFLEWAAQKIISATDVPEGLLDPLARGAIESLLRDDEGRHGGQDSGGRLIAKLSGTASSVEPGLDGAARYLTIFINESVEAWLRGVVVEFVTEFMPKIAGIGGGVEAVQKLQEVIEHALGGSRMVRRVLQPFITATAITPAQWHVNKRYRPTPLSAGAAIEAFLRGDWPFEQLTEELARQGFSSERIDVQVENARKKLAFDDLAYQHWRGELDDSSVFRGAGALGYDESTARTLLAIADLKRIDTLNAPIVTESVSAYLAGDIDQAEMERWVTAGAPNVTDANRIIGTAHARRAIRRQHITSARMRALVLEGIAAVPDYVAALVREGYPPLEVTMQELSLRKEQQADHDLEKAKAEKRKADEAAAVARAKEKAARDAALEASRARTFPALTEYRRAYVRGFVDRQAYVDALVREKIAADDAAFLLAGADADREQYLADQAAAEQHKADQAAKGLPIATREQAVLAGILSVAEFDSTLAKEKIPDADRHLLVKLLQARLADQAAAAARRADADTLAALKGTSIAEWERAVRLGVRSRNEYAAFLAALGLTEPARALILDVLDAQLAADDAAKAKRAPRDAVAAAKGISLAQRRRAVIAGVRPRAYYEQALIDEGWPVDDQLAELDLLDVEIAARAAADAKAATIVEKVAPSFLTVASLTRALSLGLITPAEFTDALRARGATAADADLLVQLAVAAVPDTRAAQSLHATVDAALAAKQLSLADLERAVLRGLVTVDQYAADLTDRGYGVDAVALLRQLLQDKVDLDVDGLQTKIAAALAKADGAPTLNALVAAFDDGTLTPAALQAQLESFGAPRDAALVYVRLLSAF